MSEQDRINWEKKHREWYRTHDALFQDREPYYRSKNFKLVDFPWAPNPGGNCPACGSEFYSFSNSDWTTDNNCLDCKYHESHG